MAVKRLTGDQYYVEMEIAEKVISRFVFDNKEDYEGFIKSMKEEGNKITAQGEF
jgi:spore coat polysaccharide biosynthesis protein SpsF (cytidylyltransferase family)